MFRRLLVSSAFLFFLFVFARISSAQDFPVLKGDFLGQAPPDSVPAIFAPGIVSVEGRYEYGLAISPDGGEIFFTAEDPGEGLMVTRRIDGVWTGPEAAHLTRSGIWEFEAFYTVDGRKVFFSAIDKEGKCRIWCAAKDSSEWSPAAMLVSSVNDVDVFWATFATDGTMYYTDIKQRRIFRSKPHEGVYGRPEEAGIAFGVHPFVSPDGTFILFNAKNDIYAAFRQDDGTWGEPQRLGDRVNSSSTETCPSLSPDGKYIFFSRYNDLEGKSNIYWVDSGIIEEARKSSLK